YRQAETCHLGEVGTLAAQQILHHGVAIGLSPAEQIDALLRTARSRPGPRHDVRSGSGMKQMCSFVLGCPYQPLRNRESWGYYNPKAFGRFPGLFGQLPATHIFARSALFAPQ